MSDSTSSAGPAVRRPRMRFLANGTPVDGVFEAGVTSNNHLSADKWTCALALSPVADGATPWWDPAGTSGTPGVSPITAEVQFAFLPDGAPEGNAPWQSFCFGDVDHVHFDPIRRVLHVDGRDLIGRLVDYRIRENYPNQTSSEIVQLLAGLLSITCDVTPTSTPVGQYYRLEHDRVSLDGFSKNQKAWDVMTYLARQEGYDIYMGPPTGGSGPANVLHFHPSAVQGTSQPGFTVQVTAATTANPIPTCNVIDLDLDRNFALAKDVRVTVKSWNAASNAASTAVYPPGGSSGSSKSAPVQDYVYIRPGLSPAAALAAAQRFYNEIVLHERVVTFSMPGELALTPRQLVAVAGTGTSWDQVYWVDEIERRLGWDSGFEEHVRCKNHSTQTEANVS